MRKIIFLSAVIGLFVCAMASTAFAQTKHDFDAKGYTKTAKKAIGMIISGNVDADKMQADMEKLVTMGVDGCREHMGEKETPEIEKKLMQLVIDNAGKMKSMSLKAIEAQWHEGGTPKAKGIDTSKFDHFAEVMCHFEAVVHPATAIICLKEYKKTKKDALLEQVQGELQEVVEHLKHLE